MLGNELDLYKRSSVIVQIKTSGSLNLSSNAFRGTNTFAKKIIKLLNF